MSLQFFTLKRTDDNIAWLTIDIPDAQQAVGADFLYELLEVIQSVQEEKLNGLVIQSARKDVFLTGIQQDTLHRLAAETPASAKNVMGFFSLGNQCCRQLARLNCPTVAIIGGACSGVGIEISLACDYRILINHDTTRLSYPEINRGFHIGFGGISRLIALAGLPGALRFLTAESGYAPSRCLEAGLADHITADYQAPLLATQLLLNPIERKAAILPRTLGEKLNPENWPGREIGLSPDPLQQQVLDHILDTYRTYGDSAEAWQEEVSSATSLLLSRTTANALYIDRLIQEKQPPVTPPQGSSRLQRIHIIGSGVMGRQLAQHCARQGLLVSVHDTRHTALASLLPECDAAFRAHYPDHPEQVQHALDRLIPDLHNDGLAHADIVIEAIQENSDAKASLLLEIDKHAKADACILTTTACLPLEELSRNMQHPERLLGLNLHAPILQTAHFPLLGELMRPANAAPHALQQARQLTHRLQLLPVEVQSAPGYLGTRLLMAYLIEALHLHESGIPITAIDQAARELGMRHPPFVLLDEIGLEECLRIQEALADRLGYDVPRILIHKVEQGIKGRASGEGFYKYRKGQRQQPLSGLIRKQLPGKQNPQSLQKQLLEALINESRICLNDKVVQHASEIDLVSVVIIGLSAAKGGTLKYLQTSTDRHVQ